MDDQRPNDRMFDRVLLFVTLSIGIVLLNSYFMKGRQQAEKQDKPAAQAEQTTDQPDGKGLPEAQDVAPVGDDATDKLPDMAEESEDDPDWPRQYVSLGSVDPASPYRMLVTLTTKGAAVVRTELSNPKYPDIEKRSGYLGYVLVDSEPDATECVVQVVGAGTPAAAAGMKPGDVILSVAGEPVENRRSLELALLTTRPKQIVSVEVKRGEERVTLQVQLGRYPVSVIRPEGDDPLSFLVTLHQLDGAKLPDLSEDKYQELRKDREEEIVPCDPQVNAELDGVSLREANWELVSSTENEAVFRRRNCGLEWTKTYRLAKASPEGADDPDYPAYHVVLVVSVRNVGKETRKLAYQLDGPTGLPTEGDWYASKVGPSMSPYGLRDVILTLKGNDPSWVRCGDISVDKLGTLKLPEDDPLKYIGVDAQYFSSIVIPQRGDDASPWLSRAHPIRVGAYLKKAPKLTDTSCRLVSVLTKLEPDDQLTRTFHVFTGPKRPPLLEQYGLRDSVYYGWFWYVAIPMQYVLHFFASFLHNYGLAIILLTVLVRSCMFPLSRKQALGAQKMQELQPELKAISEKYKKDPEALRHAQQELFRKHNYNPLSGCLPVFVQLPIFIGLYRALTVDVELRGASLLGAGVRWCSNLAAPDMLFYWGSFWESIGWGAFNTGNGMFYLGPYFNVLPLVTIALFIIQQKMFMPPAMDEQAKMQQKVMTFMMVFMGFMFFKVASGLCLYFIASSIWGVAEKKLLPKKSAGPAAVATKSPPTTRGGNSQKPPARPSRPKRKR